VAEKPKNALGPSGEMLMNNIKRIREGQRVTYVELSERLAALGRPIPVLGLRRIERGERRVDVDDLLALAKALNVSPVALLVPVDLDGDAPYGVTPALTTTAAQARAWISGRGDEALVGEAVRKLRQDVLSGKIPMGDPGDPSIPGIMWIWLAAGVIPVDSAEDILRLYNANTVRKASDEAMEGEG
jgi:transcriptional regulator with XRE-family HTH domain